MGSTDLSASPAEGITRIDYGIDALGRTASRTQAEVVSGSTVTTTTDSAFRGTSEDYVSQAVGGQTTAYAYSPAGPLAQQVGNGAPSFYAKNLHGDVVGLVSASGVAGSQSYSPYGEPRNQIGDKASIGFQGDPTDPKTGLVDMTTRNYDPSMGRFITQDILLGDINSPMSMNQYLYGNGSPVTMADLTGLVACAASSYFCAYWAKYGFNNASVNAYYGKGPQTWAVRYMWSPSRLAALGNTIGPLFAAEIPRAVAAARAARIDPRLMIGVFWKEGHARDGYLAVRNSIAAAEIVQVMGNKLGLQNLGLGRLSDAADDPSVGPMQMAMNTFRDTTAAHPGRLGVIGPGTESQEFVRRLIRPGAGAFLYGALYLKDLQEKIRSGPRPGDAERLSVVAGSYNAGFGGYRDSYVPKHEFPRPIGQSEDAASYQDVFQSYMPTMNDLFPNV